MVSIRIVPPDTPPTLRSMDFTPIHPGGQYIDSRTNLFSMIMFAYKPNHWWQLTGLPRWANEQSYTVSAKPADGFPTLSPAENTEQVRLMMRAMLAERFHLKMHTEMRKEPVLQLEVAKGGIKIKEAGPPEPPDKEHPVGAAMGNSGGCVIGKKSTMTSLANALSTLVRQDVVDKTGLKGFYDFDIKWSAPESPDQPPPAPGLGAEGIGLLISALQNQFGLRVTKTAGTLEYWVVDHVEQPTEN